MVTMINDAMVWAVVFRKTLEKNKWTIDDIDEGLMVGWLDGKGIAPTRNGLDWLAEAFQRNYPDELLPPYLYPTAEGGVQAEWSVNGWEVTLEIDLDQHQGQWHALDMADEQEQEKTLNLNEPADWQWLAMEISVRIGGDA